MSTVMLHVHNVAILGGVSTFICDLSTAYSQFYHVALHLKDLDDRSAIQMMNDHGIRTLHGKASRAVFEAIDPKVIILHNISGREIEGEHPWSWIRKWPTVSWHHSAVTPTVPTDFHVFVSEFLKKKYDGLIENKFIKRWSIIPPCIDTRKFSTVRASPDRVIGKVATPDKAEKYPFILKKVANEVGAQLMIPGGSKFYGNGPEIVSVAPAWWRVPEFLSKMAVFLYVNAPNFGPETWCRSVTEALAAGIPVVAEARGGILEQIQEGRTGFLVPPEDEYLMRARVLQILDHPGQAKKIGEAGRKWAQENADLSVLKRKLDDFLLAAAIGAVV